MKGIIIAGGLGTRLRPLTYCRPKPLVPVANRPFLEYQVALLKRYGIDDIVFATNYMADQIADHFGDGARFGVRMRYALEEKPLGTGGAIRNAASLFPGEAVAVFNGDVLTDLDIGAVLEFHQRQRALATITLSEVPSPHPFGILILDAEGKVLEWREPSEETKKRLALDHDLVPTGKDLINAGFYVLEPEFLEHIPLGEPSSIERDIYPKFIAEEAGIYGVVPGGFWMDVGRAEQLLVATQSVLSGTVKTMAPGMAIGEGTSIAPSTWINGLTAIGRQCRLDAESRLENCILMDRVTIGRHVRLSGVIIDQDVVIEDEVVVEGSGRSSAPPVIAANSRLARGTRLHL